MSKLRIWNPALRTFSFILFLLGFGLFENNAQVINRALQFGETGVVDCGFLPGLEGKDSYAIQFSIMPLIWKEDANIIEYGGSNNIKLGKKGEIKLEKGDKSFTIAHPELNEGEWSQVTVIYDCGNVFVLINGDPAGNGTLTVCEGRDDIIDNKPLLLGGGYIGKIDEVRLWDAPLNDEMEKFDYFISNTLNKWCPMIDNLLVYYKMDQEFCPYLVDYISLDGDKISDGIMYNNHGILKGDVRRVIADNPKMPYLINAAYTNNDRFFDSMIPRDQYLLSNELIILGTDVFAADGRIETKTPNNHAISLNGVAYLPEYKSRKGVIQLDGEENNGISVPYTTLKKDSPFSFETWLYLDEYRPFVDIIKSKSGSTKEKFSVSLAGNSENPVILIESMDSNSRKRDYVSRDLKLPIGKWFHMAVTFPNNNQLSPGLYIDGEKIITDLLKEDKFLSMEYMEDSENVPLSSGNETHDEIIIGNSLKGFLDESVIWNKELTGEEILIHMKEVPMPGINKVVDKNKMRSVGAFYRFDDLENLGFSSHSQDAWLNIMKSAYDNSGGVKYYISVQGTYRLREPFGDWREILPDEEKRKRFVSDLAKISNNYDGVELDLEWIENAEEWENFGILAKEIKYGLPEGKEFRISLHNNYTAFPEDKMEYVDGFTFQQYGPNSNNFSFDNFLGNVEKFKERFDTKKIMTSYATTTSRGVNGTPPSGVRWEMLEKYQPGDQDIDSFTNAKDTWRFTGPIQVYQRAKQTLDQNLQGIFYWDMGNDYWERSEAGLQMPEYNLAKYCSYGINSNIDPIIKEVTVKHFSESDSQISNPH